MKILYSIVLILITVYASAQETVSLGAGYTQDVYYQLNSKEKTPVSNSNWTLAFATSAFDVSIRVNHLLVPHVYAIDGDSAAFATINLNSVSGTDEYFNSDESWEYGALNMPATGSQFDYGWGSYDPGSHNVNGSRIFVLEFANGDYKKVFIKKKSVANVYGFMVANLDNSEFVNQSFSGSTFGDRMFYYYDASSNTLLNREPVTDNWDLLFCRYYGLQPNEQYYPVAGVLQHKAVKVIQLDNINVQMITPDLYMDSTYSENISSIGYDWKTLNAQFQYEMVGNRAYIVKAQDNNVYSIVFNSFGGSANGNIVFNQVQLEATSVNTVLNDMNVYVLNNPVNDILQVVIDATATAPVQLDLMNLNGQVLSNKQNVITPGIHLQSFDVTALSQGIYLLRIVKDGAVMSMKVVKM